MSRVSSSNNKHGSVVVNNKWIMDSGAAVHVSPNRMFFHTYKVYDGNFSLRGFNGLTSKAIGYGSVKLKMYDGAVVELKDVWHVPQAKSNLISAGALHSCGFELQSASDGTMNITRDSQVVMKATRMQNNNVYYLIGEAAYDQSHRVTINDNNNNNNSNNNNKNKNKSCPPRVYTFSVGLLIVLLIALVVSLKYVH